MKQKSRKHVLNRTGVFATRCCGVKELYPLQNTPEETFKDIFYPRDEFEMESAGTLYKDYWGWLERDRKYFPHVIFHDYDRRGCGLDFAGYIRKNSLGEILVTEARQNPNSGNMVRVFVWSPNYKACKSLLKTLETLCRTSMSSTTIQFSRV